MVKRLLAVAVAGMFAAGMVGCSADCEVCIDMGADYGGKVCETVKDVKKKDCKDCAVEGADAAKALGLDVTCSVK